MSQFLLLLKVWIPKIKILRDKQPGSFEQTTFEPPMIQTWDTCMQHWKAKINERFFNMGLHVWLYTGSYF